MRLHSTPQSSARGELSLLALVECLFSAVLCLWVARVTRNFLHLEVAICLAPLFLLRTRYSYQFALRRWKAYLKALDRLGQRTPSQLFPIFVLALCFSFFVGMTIRFISTLQGVIRHPLLTLERLPKNWVRQTLSTDLFRFPEIVPGEENISDYSLTIKGAVEEIASGPTKTLLGVAEYLAVILVTLICFVPATIFRITYKSTALFYLPLTFITQITLRSRIGLQLKLERIVSGEIEKTRRIIALFLLSASAIKLALMNGLIDRKFLVEKVASEQFANLVLSHWQWPWWQIALEIDATLTFVLFYFAEAALGRLKGNEPWPAQWVKPILAATTFVRALLATLAVLLAVVPIMAAVAQMLSRYL